MKRRTRRGVPRCSGAGSGESGGGGSGGGEAGGAPGLEVRASGQGWVEQDVQASVNLPHVVVQPQLRFAFLHSIMTATAIEADPFPLRTF